MRESSYNFSTQNSQQPKDIRGGEKKVMKKSLSAILSLAMAFSMFSSVALGADAKKSSANFTDLKDLDAATKAKFDEMIGAGIFDGVKEGTFGLKDKMNRAQFAKVAALVFNLKVDTSLKTSSFSDVKSDDPANGYALPYIEAVKAAGITDGYAPGQFNPAGDVTKEQLATFLIRGLGKDSEGKNKTGVSDKTVSDWAKSYVALALELKLLGNGTDGTFGGTSAATRDLLVTSSYEAKKLASDLNKPAKASVKEVKAVDYNKVQVTLDRDVDTSKATLALKKGTADVATTVKWSDDKKVATLTLKDDKIVEATYSVTLGGLDASTVDKTTGEFKGEVERLAKIDFVTANETIAKSPKVRVQFKPTNQYGQNVSFSSGSFSVFANTPDTPTLYKDNDTGKFYVNLKTDVDSLIPNSSQVSITINDTENRVQGVTKVFKVGDKPYVTKVELGDVTYKNGKDSLKSNGDTAVIKMTQYDQYGGEIVIDSKTAYKPSVNLAPVNNIFESALKSEVKDDNGDGVDDVVVWLTSNITTTGEYNVNVYGSGTTATAKIKLNAAKTATKVELVQPTETWAVGDRDKYVEIVAYDANDTKLSADDIVDNAKQKRFNISTSFLTGATDDVPASILASETEYKIVTAGEHKGKLHISRIENKGTGNVFVGVFANGVNSQKQINIPVSEARYPNSIKTVTEPATKAVAGGETKPKFQILDQYGEKLTKLGAVELTQNGSNGGTVTYDVYATVTRPAGKGSVSVDGVKEPLGDGKSLAFNWANKYTDFTNEFSDKEVTINTAGLGANESIEVKFAVRKFINGKLSDESAAQVTKKVTVIDKNNETLTYSVSAGESIFATQDDSTYKDSTDLKAIPITANKLSKELVLTAKDSSGNTVVVPKNITAVTPEVYNYVRSGVVTEGKDVGKAYIIGNKAGTSNVTVSFTDYKGNPVFATTSVTVKTEPITIASMEAGKATKTFSTNFTKPAYELMGDLTIKSQYGNEFKNENIRPYFAYLGVKYYISDVTGTVKAELASNAANEEQIKVTGTGSFVLKAVAPNGKSAMTTIVVK